MQSYTTHKKYRLVGRKKIVAAKDLQEGDQISRSLVAFKRADYGSQLEDLDIMLGKSVYTSFSYTDEILDIFYRETVEIFKKIQSNIVRDDLHSLLDGPVKHTGFERLGL